MNSVRSSRTAIAVLMLLLGSASAKGVIELTAQLGVKKTTVSQTKAAYMKKYQALTQLPGIVNKYKDFSS